MDDDVLEAANNCAISWAISEGRPRARFYPRLARAALEPRDVPRMCNGVPLFKPEKGAKRPSLALVNRLRDAE